MRRLESYLRKQEMQRPSVAHSLYWLLKKSALRYVAGPLQAVSPLPGHS